MLDNLNSEQKKAVLCTKGPLLILAGAGSGKTRVITRRIAYLVKEEGVDPYNILAITFTNKAAKEMKERVEDLLGGSAQGMIISTFHSACVRILRKEIQKAGYSSNFNIYDSGDSLGLVKSVLKDLELSDSQFQPKAILSMLGKIKDSMRSPEEYGSEHAVGYYEQKVALVYAEYQKRLKKSNALDFDDIIYLTVKILSENKHVLEYYQERFRYILVDEYQDTNKLQFELIRLLAGRHRNLCVVGDDDQSIFMWRGANIQNILSFEKTFKGAKVVKLEQNYRSSANILEAANNVIKGNANRKEKKLWTDKEKGERIKLCRLLNEYHEGRFIAQEAKRLVDAGEYKYSDMAVLYRMNAQSRNIEEALLALSVPYIVFGGLEFYKRKEVKDVLAYLKLIYNENDAVSFERAVMFPKRGVGGGTIEKLRADADNRGISVFAAAREPDKDLFGPAQRKNLMEFSGLMDDLKNYSNSSVPSKIIARVIEKAGILKEYERTQPLEYEVREQNITELVSIALQHESDGIMTLSEFLETVALISDTDVEEEEDSRVSLMTLHSSKGLEFPVVFIAGFEEGIFPSERSMYEPAELEEERRLCYVGMTRAMDNLYLTCTQARTIFGKTAYYQVSRFFFDIPDDMAEEYKTDVAQRTQVWNNSYAPTTKGAVLLLGDKVIHKRFGRGVVVDMVKEEKDTIIEIEFEGVGRRRLIEAYANLEKL